MSDIPLQLQSGTGEPTIVPHAAASDLPPLDRVKVGMACFLGSEAAFFGTLLVAYVIYLGQSTSGPTPSEVLGLGTAVANTFFLLTSSLTITFAIRAFTRDNVRRFLAWMAVTMILGGLFLGGTAWEWYDLIANQGLTLRTNLFGTTFFTLVGFHAGHVITGLFVMLIFVVMAGSGLLRAPQSLATEMLGWYWHFVDGVWVVILVTVYLLGR